jgi:hypothetical protein
LFYFETVLRFFYNRYDYLFTMSELSKTDLALLQQLKKKIEQLSGIQSNTDLNQKDFDFLLYYIQEKTGQPLSLTTLKRIWRDEYQRLPHLSTLNMLAQLAFNKDWHTLKKEFLETQSSKVDQTGDLDSVQHSSPGLRLHQRLSIKVISLVIGTGLLILIIATSGYNIAGYQKKDFGNIPFSASPTSDLRIPNSVVFTYDVSGINAEHFYIQQSWDPAKKVEISSESKNQTDIYYEPGYHYAKLLVNDQVAKEIPVHVKYENWYIRFRYPDSRLVKVNDADLNKTGPLGLNDDFIAHRFHPLNDQFQLGYMLSKDFGLRADEFDISALIKFDSAYAPVCPMVNVLIKGDRDYAWITVGNTGCESNLGLKVGDTHVSGKTNDLSLLGLDAFSWQQIRVKMSKGRMTLFINNKIVRQELYSNQLGDLKEVDFFFNGIGGIDEIKM